MVDNIVKLPGVAAGAGEPPIRRLGTPAMSRARFIQDLVARRVAAVGFQSMPADQLVALAVAMADEVERRIGCAR